MNQQDAETIIAIATLAVLSDGQQDPSEHTQLTLATARLGLANADRAVKRAVAGELDLAELSTQLSGAEARQAAYETAVAICHADGAVNTREADFLRMLATTLAINPASASAATTTATAASAAAAIASSAFTLGSTAAPLPVPSAPQAASAPNSDEYILDQAILTGALELLPDGLASIGILPLQMRLVRHIGAQYGQQMDAAQVKDLAATFGIGAAAQIMESIVRKTLGGIAGGLLGGFLGGAAGMAAGGAVTFASTYALGHAAQQYYAQKRTLSTADMKALFARFQGEANTMFPRVQERITTLARGRDLESLMRTVRG